MAAAGEDQCLSEPNFAVICSFLDKYGETLGFPTISYVDLQRWIEDTKHGKSDADKWDIFTEQSVVYMTLCCRLSLFTNKWPHDHTKRV